MHRGLAWAGIVFAVLYSTGVVFSGWSPDETKKEPVHTDASALGDVWREFYSQGDNRWTIIIGWLILVAVSIAFEVFAGELRQRFADAGAPGAGRLTFAGALLFAAVTIAGAVVLAWIPMAKELGNSPVPDGELNYMTTVVGYGFILMAGGVTVALMLVTAGRASVRTGVLPAWLGQAGVVVGVILFFLAMVFIPMALLVVWVLVAAIVMIRRGPVVPSATVATALAYGDDRARSLA